MKNASPDITSSVSVAKIRRGGKRVLAALETLHADIEMGRIDEAASAMAAIVSGAREQDERVRDLLEAIAPRGSRR